MAGFGRSVLRSHPRETGVALGLAGDLLFDHVGDRIRDEVEDQHLRFPPLAGDVDARFEHTPASLIEDRLCAGERLGALVAEHHPDGYRS